MKPRATHTTFYTGAKIRIILRNGSVIIAKFKERLGHRALRTDKGDFPIPIIRSANYYKPQKHELET
jgi:hypothetical protein